MLIRLYRATLALYPADVRASIADEQTALFARLVREERPEGLWARARWTAAMLMGSVRGALGVRRDRRRRGLNSTPSPFRRRRPDWSFTVSDLRQVVRSLLQARWFTGAAVLTFALGIGVNVAVFSVVDRVLFRDLPYADPDELVVLGEFEAGSERPYGTMSGTDVLVVSERHSAILGMSVADWSSGGFTTSPEISAEPVIRLTPSSYTTLSVFGVRPILGRDFTQDDARANARYALIGYDTWQRRFDGSRDVLGARIWSNRQPTEIIGVLPDGFIPASSRIDPLSDGLVLEHTTLDASVSERTTPPFVRLRPGTTIEAAQVELDAISASLPGTGEDSRTSSLRFIPVRTLMFGYFGPAVWLVIVAATVVLLVASANLAALLLVRGRARERTAAIQVALGASRGRLMASALLEAGILAAAGAVVALLALVWTAGALQSLLPPLFAGYAASVLDLRILGFAVLAIAASALVAGGWPAWRIARVEPLLTLQASGTGRSTSVRGSAAVIAVEAALTVVLVAGAALAGRTLVNLLQTDVGFEVDGLQQVIAHLPFDQPPDVRYRGSLDMLDVLRQHPGVTAAAGADVVPTIPAIASRFGGDFGPPAHRVRTTGRLVETMGLELMAGRDMSDADVQAGRRVGLLSRSALRLVWPDVEPAGAIGRLLEFDGEPAIDVVGVVSDAASSLTGRTVPTLYVPVGAEGFRTFMFLARADAGSLSVEGLRDRFRDAGYEPLSISLDEVSTMYVGRIRDQRFRAVLFSSFGAIGLLLAAIGIYALTAFEVSRRQAEMGIRTALGARAGRLQGLVISQALRPVVVGVAAGVAISYWAAQFLQSFLFQVDARDPGTLAVVAATVLAAAAAGAWIPARRASRVDPVVVLRAQ